MKLLILLLLSLLYPLFMYFALRRVIKSRVWIILICLTLVFLSSLILIPFTYSIVVRTKIAYTYFFLILGGMLIVFYSMLRTKKINGVRVLLVSAVYLFVLYVFWSFLLFISYEIKSEPTKKNINNEYFLKCDDYEGHLSYSVEKRRIFGLMNKGYRPMTSYWYEFKEIDSVIFIKQTKLGMVFRYGSDNLRNYVVLIDNEDDSTLNSYDSYEIYRDFFKVKKNGKFGIVDCNAVEIIQPIFDEIIIEEYSCANINRLIMVKKDGYTGLYTLEGKELLNYGKSKFTYIRPYTGEKNAVIDGKECVINDSLKIVINK